MSAAWCERAGVHAGDAGARVDAVDEAGPAPPSSLVAESGRAPAADARRARLRGSDRSSASLVGGRKRVRRTARRAPRAREMGPAQVRRRSLRRPWRGLSRLRLISTGPTSPLSFADQYLRDRIGLRLDDLDSCWKVQRGRPSLSEKPVVGPVLRRLRLRPAGSPGHRAPLGGHRAAARGLEPTMRRSRVADLPSILICPARPGRLDAASVDRAVSVRRK